MKENVLSPVICGVEQEEELSRRDQSIFLHENSREAPRGVGGNRSLAPVTHCSVATLYSWSQRTGQWKMTPIGSAGQGST